MSGTRLICLMPQKQFGSPGFAGHSHAGRASISAGKPGAPIAIGRFLPHHPLKSRISLCDNRQSLRKGQVASQPKSSFSIPYCLSLFVLTGPFQFLAGEPDALSRQAHLSDCAPCHDVFCLRGSVWIAPGRPERRVRIRPGRRAPDRLATNLTGSARNIGRHLGRVQACRDLKPQNRTPNPGIDIPPILACHPPDRQGLPALGMGPNVQRQV